jgi:hypothetical protein
MMILTLLDGSTSVRYPIVKVYQTRPRPHEHERSTVEKSAFVKIEERPLC